MILINFLRSILFHILYLILNILLGGIGTLSAPFNKKGTNFIGDMWGYGVKYALLIVGIKIKVEGKENLKPGQYIFASKHQSDLETAVLRVILRDFKIVFVVKKALTKIPFWGWTLSKTGSIAVDRNGSLKDLNQMIKKAQKRVSIGHSIIIFPEGTRRMPKAEPKYLSGAAFLYKKTNLPVIPIALNSGLFWPKKRLILTSGTVIFKIMPAIKQGLDSKEFMRILENTIETETNKLYLRTEKYPA